ncbi:MaoC family dehydratase [Kordiimonas laminariae]|uniref:MaoC family dehydratase n=1 Tax=Kordiimonas laminariae TaxID=2917717 RepID=UPI001FF6ECDE|nr:MaoC family dehydratase [Kordiimonas laminariae]MCK0067928.1 MaoC family dehydratase [Kordiimonas laminariae]
MYKVFFEDIAVGDVQKFGSYEVTREEILEFASKYDPQPFHLDDEAAKHSVFGKLCASGWHTGAMMMRMLVDHVKATGAASMGSPGLDEIRWLEPVFPGETLSVETEILGTRESKSRPNIGLIKAAYKTFNQDGTLKMTAISNYMILRRPK